MLLRIGVVLSVVAVAVAVAAAVFLWLRLDPTGGRGAQEEIEPSPAGVTASREVGEKTSGEGSPGESPPDEAGSLRETEEGWQIPEGDDLDILDGPRRFEPNPDASLTLTIPALGIRGAPVLDSDGQEALNAGVAHVPETSMPWDGGEQTNVYLAGHRLGYEGTASRLLFYNLDRLGPGDVAILRGRGETYKYRVYETLVVDPDDSWVMGQVVGEHLLSLQTCTPIPTFEKRLVVRAERV